MGLIPEARHAGILLAAKLIMTISAGTVVHVTGSKASIPNKRLSSTLVRTTNNSYPNKFSH